MDNIGFLNNQDDILVAMFPENASMLDRNIMKNSGEAFYLIKQFVDDVNSGSLRAKAATKKFEALLEKTFSD